MNQRETQRSGIVSGRLILILLTALALVLLPKGAVADDECITTSGHIVSCFVSLEPAEDGGCTYPHIHGTIDGDTDPLGACGHGSVTVLVHLGSDGPPTVIYAGPEF